MTAILSPCGTWRYRLERRVDFFGGPTLAFFGVNPSTADAELDDATVRKWRGFTARAGASAFIVGNVFAFRATEVKELATAGDPIGPDNADHLAKIMADADVLVPCWGDRAKVPAALRHHFTGLELAIRLARKPVKCFGVTAGGDPLHPLMLGYIDHPLRDWTR